MLALLFAFVASLTFGDTPAPSLRVRAVAGIGEELWVVEMAADGSVDLELTHLYKRDKDLKRSFGPSDARIGAVRRALESAEFLKLPANIIRKLVTVDATGLRLAVTAGKSSHEVYLYEPEELVRDKRAKRFLSVWNALFDSLPIRPSSSW